MNPAVPETQLVRPLADWMLKNGVGLAFIAIALLLLFVYFAKLIFTKPPMERIEEIYKMVLEIKIKLEDFLEGKGKGGIE